MPEATITYKSFLMMMGDTDYEKLLDIKDYPDMGGEQNTVETTTLSDSAERFIPGIDSNVALPFTANYDPVTYAKLLALKNQEKQFALWLGGDESPSGPVPTGVDGKWEWTGYLSVYLTGGGVNDVRGMSISIMPSSEITSNVVGGVVMLTGAFLLGAQESVNTDALVLKYSGTPTPAPTLTYEWQVATTVDGNYSAISGGTAAVYKPGAGDKGKFIRCKVQASGSAMGIVVTNPVKVIEA